MESTYERLIDVQEELLMKYKAVKKLNILGYSVVKKDEDILIFYGKDNLGRLTFCREEKVPMAVIEKRNSSTNISQAINRRNVKNILLDIGWAVSTPN